MSVTQNLGLFCRLLRRIREDCRGVAILELAVMLPPLIIIGFGVLEFGNLIYKRHLIEAGVRDAARYMAGMPDCNNQKQAAVYLANTGTTVSGGTPRVAGWALAVGDINCASVAAAIVHTTYGTHTLRGQNLAGNLTMVRIRSVVNYSAIDLGFLTFLNRLGVGYSTLSFPVSHEERWYGNR